MSYSPGNRLTVGTPGATNLVDYGIQTEQSDLRAHVCVAVGLVYVFRTADALRVMQAGIAKGLYKPRQATQPGASGATAQGYAVPVADLSTVPIRAQHLIEAQAFNPQDSTTDKGRKAVAVVVELLGRGWFPLLSIRAQESADARIQVSGVDLLVSGQWRIQVKCDFYGGSRPQGTGNLFLQTAERNPFGRV